MKNKVTLLVLVAEIIGIVVLHSQRSGATTTDTDRSATIQSESQFRQATDKRVSYTSLK
jgi:hypothetical protein